MIETAWNTANRDSLATALADVKNALERYATRNGGAEGDASAATAESDAAPGRDRLLTSLDALSAMFELSPFERRVVVLCAGMELDAAFPSLCAAALGDPRRAYPTFGLALAALAEPHWSALAPTGALRHWRLVEVGAGDGLATSPLRLDERILHFLLGVTSVDERLAGWVDPIAPGEALPPSQQAVAVALVELWRRAGTADASPVVQLCGDDALGKHAVAALACASLGMGLHVLRAADLPALAGEREPIARLWEREAILSRSALFLDAEEIEGEEGVRTLVSFLGRLRGAVVVGSREPLSLRSRLIRSLDVNRPGPEEQRALWRESLGSLAERLNGELDGVVGQFSLGPQAIRDASAEVTHLSREFTQQELRSLLWQACRAQARPRLDDLARRLPTAATWDDLVLPPAPREVLSTIAAHLRQRSRVYEAWGFAAKGPRGLGISALFSGASGTGKTLAAEVLANELGLDLYRIDLSVMVSKYVGETEKNLRRVFDAAEDGGAILLFDEADALFGKRSEVKDSHDRYANIEVSYLLQRVEAYRGLAILTSNMKSAIDPAFLRRIRFVVPFAFPDAGQRAEIWRRVFTPQTPTEALDIEQLARLALSGGNIRNLALNAAFLAADAEEPVRMKHLLQAARSEYAKLEKPLSESEIGGWE